MTEFDPQIHGPELSAYLDGELDAADRAAVDQLLAGSPAARRELEQLRAISGGLRGLSRHAAPDAVLAGIGARDKRHTVHSEAPLGPRSSRRILEGASMVQHTRDRRGARIGLDRRPRIYKQRIGHRRVGTRIC